MMPNVHEKEEIAFYLGTLVTPQKIRGDFMGKKRNKKEINQIYETLYKFSITKIDKLLENKFIGCLFKHFISDAQIVESIIESCKISQESYRIAFNIIKQRTSELIQTN